jgi:phosphatidylglycerophosphatase A
MSAPIIGAVLSPDFLAGATLVCGLALMTVVVVMGWGTNSESRSAAEHQAAWPLVLAQGFGAGRISWAPGTWGSLVGVLWTWYLLGFEERWIGVLIGAFSIMPAIAVCSRAEQLLKEKDPPSVVLDEIVALPLVFLAAFVPPLNRSAAAHSMDRGIPAYEWALGFLFFRLYDIWKPWPIRRLQILPGGVGVVVDDLAAAVFSLASLLMVRSVIRLGLISFV